MIEVCHTSMTRGNNHVRVAQAALWPVYSNTFNFRDRYNRAGGSNGIPANCR